MKPTLPSHPDEEGPIAGPSETNNHTTQHSSQTLLKRFRQKLLRSIFWSKPQDLEKEVVDLIEEHDPEGTQIGLEERTILSNVLSLNDTKVSDIMVPRTDIIAVENTISLDDLRSLIIEKEHTRIPVYKDSLDSVTGFIHIKDLMPLLGGKKKFSLKNLLREILFVPATMRVSDLLLKMRASRVHMAIILDEYGGTDGLVTMENLMEEIVGEIEDEHDEQEQLAITKLTENSWEANARVPIEDLEAALAVALTSKDTEDDYETLGGLIFATAGRVPQTGETITYDKLTFTIKSADARRIEMVGITLESSQT